MWDPKGNMEENDVCTQNLFIDKFFLDWKASIGTYKKNYLVNSSTLAPELYYIYCW